MTVLVYDQPNFLTLEVLRRDINVVLLPIDEHFDLSLEGERRLDDEIIEPSTDKGIGPNIGIRHIILSSYLLLFQRNFILWG